jgi:hypothetical protein
MCYNTSCTNSGFDKSSIPRRPPDRGYILHLYLIPNTLNKMAHKSHRQKALQSQLEERPAISLITNEEKPKKSKAAKKVKPSTTASALASSASMEVDEPAQVPEAQHVEDDDGDILIDNATASTSAVAPVASTSTSSGFAPLALGKSNGVLKNEFRRIPVPAHRMSPLRRDWVAMYTPMVEHLGLQVRMNEKRRCVEIRVSLVLADAILEARKAKRHLALVTGANARHRITPSTLVPSKKEPISLKPMS